MLENIIKENNDLLNENYKKVTSSNKNEVYIFDNQYILKICINQDNEINFLNEINFYRENKDNQYIPHIYKYNNKTKPYYIITEKLDGISVFNIWYKLNNQERKKIITNITNFLREIHTNKRESNHWENIMINNISNSLDKIRNLELLDENTLDNIEKIVINSKNYLITDTLSMIHGNIQFDNVFLTADKEIKIIDFETSSYAPIDFELDAIMRMCYSPLHYANNNQKDYINQDDYNLIPEWLKEEYPELFKIDNLKKRLLIYDLYYNIKYLTKHINDSKAKRKIVSIAQKLNKS